MPTHTCIPGPNAEHKILSCSLFWGKTSIPYIFSKETFGKNAECKCTHRMDCL